jgi:hypothetical protein
LPAWLTQMATGAQPYVPPASAAPGWQAAPAPRMGVASMPANQMVDDAALPDWLKAASAGASYTPGTTGMRQPALDAGQLVDPNALPGWARDAGPNGAGQQGARAGNSDWLTDSRMPAAGRNGGARSAWLRDNGPNNGPNNAGAGADAPRAERLRRPDAGDPIGKEEMPNWLRGGRGNGEQPRSHGSRRDPADEADTRARSVRSGRGRPRDYEDYEDEQMADDGSAEYENWNADRSRGKRRGFFGFFRRK